MFERSAFSAPKVFNVKKRMRLMLMIMLLFPLCIAGRLFYLQLFRHEQYSSQAERTIYNYLAEDRVRGGIYDVNGRSLAQSVRTHSCGIVKRYVKDKNATINFLAQTLGLPKAKISENWKKHKNFFFVAKKIKPDVYMELASVLRKPLGRGLELTPEYERIHPFGNSAIDILGEANSKNVGLSGIEQMYNEEMTQDISKKRAKRSARGDIIYDRRLKEKINVANVYLTIDETAQYYTERALQKAVELNHPEHAIALVQDPNTGNILAAASYPAKDGQSLAFQFTYEPGSTFKLITAAAALDSAHADDRTKYKCNGAITVAGVTLRCLAAHGTQDLNEAVGHSCNPALAKAAMDTGGETLYNYIDLFGFDDKTGVDLPGEANSIVKDPKDMSIVDLATTGYGQGIAITPLQVLCAINSFGTNGVLMKPKIVKKIVDDNGNTIKEFEDVKVRQVVSEPTAEKLKEIMEYYVSDAGGTTAYVPGLRIGGKTGTANFVEGKRYSAATNTSFVVMAPMDDPKISMICIVYRPTKKQYGSNTAGPIVKEITEKSLQYMGVEKVYSKEEQKKNKKNYVKVPDVTGKDSNVAINTLNYKELKHIVMPESDDNKSFVVVDQYPKAGTKVEKGSSVYIYSE